MSCECHEYYTDAFLKCGKHMIDMNEVDMLEDVFLIKVLHSIAHMRSVRDIRNETKIQLVPTVPENNIHIWCDGTIQLGSSFWVDPEIDGSFINMVVFTILKFWNNKRHPYTHSGIVANVLDVCTELYKYSTNAKAVQNTLNLALYAVSQI